MLSANTGSSRRCAEPLTPPRLIGHCDVHVNVTFSAHSCVLRCPLPLCHRPSRIFIFRTSERKKAAPFSARWQAPGALAGELIDQGLLCSGSMAKNVRTSRAISAAIWSAHLRRRYRIPEIFLRCCRGSPRSFSISRLTYSANEIPSAAALAWARRCNSGSTLMCLRIFIWSSIANVDSMPRAAQAVTPYRSSCASCRRPPRNWRR